MRKCVVFAVSLLFAATTAWAQGSKNAKSETLLRWQFAGTKHLATIKDLKTMREVLALPETRALTEAAASNFAARASVRFAKNGETNANPEVVKLIQPLLLDVWENESRFQMGTKGAEDADWMLAVKLDRNRAQEWSRALAELANRSGMEGASGNANAWTAKRDNYRVSFSRSRDWAIVEGGFGAPEAKMAKDFRSDLNRRRGKRVLEAEVNSPLLAKIWGAPKLGHIPRLILSAEPKREGIHSELLVEYPEELGIKPEKWNVPTGLVREPLIGFTAIQGIEKKLAEHPKVRQLGAKETPNQIFVWGQSGSPFALTIAADVQNPAEVVTNATKVLQQVKLPVGQLWQATNEPALAWTGLMMAIPYLDVGPAPHSSFLRAQFWPTRTLGENNAAPPELFAQLQKKNLVYYDWELTGARLEQWVMFWQLGYISATELAPNNSAPSALLLRALFKRLGNTVTEGTLDNARRVKLVRQSPLGFNALELLLLAHWVDTGDLIPQMSRAKGSRPQKSVPVPTLPP
jgi:hypothetical protein